MQPCPVLYPSICYASSRGTTYNVNTSFFSNQFIEVSSCRRTVGWRSSNFFKILLLPRWLILSLTQQGLVESLRGAASR